VAEVLVRLEKASRHYGAVKALDQVDLEIREGEWLAVMGPSGSGKSTLVNLLAALDRPTGGRVIVGGTDLTTLSEEGRARFRRENVGVIFQQFHLLPFLNAVENVMVAQHYHSMPDEAEAMAALERVGLKDRALHLPSQLSGGEQQRVCVARALVNQPRLILADEPTGNLDSETSIEVMTLFQELWSSGITIVLVTHEPDIAAFAGRVLDMKDGRVRLDRRQQAENARAALDRARAQRATEEQPA
jgi:putative ABC transport system ATP-binding protein